MHVNAHDHPPSYKDVDHIPAGGVSWRSAFINESVESATGTATGLSVERGAANITVHSEHNMDYRRIKRVLFVNVFMNFVFISLQKKEGK